MPSSATLAVNGLCNATSFFRPKSSGPQTTWTHPGSKKGHQLDCFFVQRKDLKRVTHAHIFQCHIGSDHTAVRLKLRIRRTLKKIDASVQNVWPLSPSTSTGPSSKLVSLGSSIAALWQKITTPLLLASSHRCKLQLRLQTAGFVVPSAQNRKAGSKHELKPSCRLFPKEIAFRPPSIVSPRMQVQRQSLMQKRN